MTFTLCVASLLLPITEIPLLSIRDVIGNSVANHQQQNVASSIENSHQKRKKTMLVWDCQKAAASILPNLDEDSTLHPSNQSRELLLNHFCSWT